MHYTMVVDHGKCLRTNKVVMVDDLLVDDQCLMMKGIDYDEAAQWMAIKCDEP